MRRLLVVVMVAAGAWIGPVQAPAGACSCAASPGTVPIDVDATAAEAMPTEGGDQLATFHPDEVRAGTVADEFEVLVLVGDASSCGIQPVPEVGGRYRLGLYEPEDGGPYQLNLCGGTIQALAAPPVPADGAPAGGSGGAAPDHDPPPYAAIVVGALAVTTALLLVVPRLRRPSS